MSLEKIKKDLEKLANPAQAKVLAGFFKTGKGQYGEGDIFRGIKVPQIRELVKMYHTLITLDKVEILLHSEYHEDRLCALLLLVKMMANADDTMQTSIYKMYSKNTSYINNWDLVDLSAPQIAGSYLKNRPRLPLYKWAKSSMLWERRIAVLSTFHYIKQNDFADALNIIESLLGDTEDLMHKACGWMLREIAKRNQITVEQFLQKHYSQLPRTTLRYAIERFDELKRLAYLKGSFKV